MKKYFLYGSVFFLTISCNSNSDQGQRSANTIDYDKQNTEGKMNNQEDSVAPYPKIDENVERRKNPNDLDANKGSTDPDTLYSTPKDRGNKNPTK